MVDIPARVLIVDDDDRSRAVASSLLRGSSNAVEFAASGMEALEVARRWRPDLVLLDIMMPDVDGFEVCRRLRADPEVADQRVFMLTALDDAASRLAAFEAGADEFLTKPFDRVEMLTRIQGIARLNRFRDLVRRRRAVDPDPAAAEHPSAPLEVERTLAEALDSLTLWYQPIVRREDGVSLVFAHEALIRTPSTVLNHPVALLAAARRLGRLEELSGAVRRCLAARAVTHPEATLFFNLHPAEILDNALYAEDDVLAPYASRIVVEITEQESTAAISGVRHRINALRRRGFRIAVDDMGSGFASLQSLVLIEPDFVKLDHSIVHHIDRDPKRRAIVQSMIELARDLGIEMIAEGVETWEECRTLEAIGCRYLQGFLFGRPEPEPRVDLTT